MALLRFIEVLIDCRGIRMGLDLMPTANLSQLASRRSFQTHFWQTYVCVTLLNMDGVPASFIIDMVTYVWMRAGAWTRYLHR